MPVELHHGDCMDVLSAMPDNSIDSVVTDPPYEIGMMNKHWDSTGVAFRPETWAAVLRVLKPGAFLVAFASTRGYHRMVCAIEDAGFIIHPMTGWIFGTGFPKATRFKDTPELDGWRYGLQALKPALEPICLAQKPLVGTGPENWRLHGVGGLNIDACRVEGVKPDTTRGGHIEKHRVNDSHEDARNLGRLKPQGRILDDGKGRWPANLLHDGSEEVMEAFAAFGESKSTGGQASLGAFRAGKIYGVGKDIREKRDPGFGDTGTAARFFYCAKASKADRAGSKHPTVKPLSLMQWLCRLVTPPGGTILDPFAGSGTTGQAAVMEGFNAILIEKEAEYCADIRRRLGLGDFQLTAAAD